MKRFGISSKQDLEELQQILADAKADAEARVKLLEMHLKKTVPFETQFLEECKLRINRIDKLIEIFNCSENETVKEGVYMTPDEFEKERKKFDNTLNAQCYYVKHSEKKPLIIKGRCKDCKSFAMHDMKEGVFQYKCDKGCFVNHPDAPCCKHFEEL